MAKLIPMKKIITAENAKIILLSILGLIIGYHLLIIIGVIPPSFVWGEDFDEASVMPLELISIVIRAC